MFFTIIRFFLPVDIQHNQCPSRFFNPINREVQTLWSQNYDTEILHCCAVLRVDNAMPCHRTGYDRHGIHNTRKSADTQRHKAGPVTTSVTYAVLITVTGTFYHRIFASNHGRQRHRATTCTVISTTHHHGYRLRSRCLCRYIYQGCLRVGSNHTGRVGLGTGDPTGSARVLKKSSKLPDPARPVRFRNLHDPTRGSGHDP